MDSITQFVLGASIAIAVSPKKSAKVALAGGLMATLPDLDVFYDHGNDLLNTVNHRGWTHSLLYLTGVAPLVGWLGWKIVGLFGYWRWLLIAWLALTTHAILDSFTIFGTSLFLGLSEMRVMIGSIFIVDPVYTIPLLVSFVLAMKGKEGFRDNKNFNSWALGFSSLYLMVGLGIQQVIVPDGRSFATPTPFNILKWRVVEMNEREISEYFIDVVGNRSVGISMKNNQGLAGDFEGVVEKYRHFSNGFFNVEVSGNKMVLVDLRMGRLGKSAFRFVIAEMEDGEWVEVEPYRDRVEIEVSEMYGEG